MMLKHYMDDLTKHDQAYSDGYSDGFEAGRQYERDTPSVGTWWDRFVNWLLK